jgi:exodeoxyribonuclease V alpha subunit
MQKDKPQLDLRGQVERITYYNDENGYTIAKMKVQGRVDLVTVVGTLFSVSPGEVLKLVGYWDRHPKYGEQFKILSHESVMPATAKGIERYLGSGMIKGIGPVMAKRLVAMFGSDTLTVIEEQIDRLLEVPGIGEKRIDMIRKAWEEQKDIRDVMVFLQGNGVSPTYAMKIYRYYGKDSVRTVSENPYRLAMDIFGIGFIMADRIAEKLGIPKESQVRAEAGILHVLHELSDEGHIYYPQGRLVKKCSEILDVGEENILPALDSIAAQEKVIIEDCGTRDTGSAPGAGCGSGTKEKAVYLTKLYVSETGVAGQLKALVSFPKQLRLLNIEQAIEWAQKLLKIALSEKQIEALRDSITSKAMVITGGPGTGKTTIINAIIKIYERMGQKVLLAAPTGRASKRMTEATGHEAKTVHRLLEYSPGSASRDNSGFKKNETNPLEADLIIIDETSMMDTVLTYHFLKAVPSKTTLILVGDVDQLPSVGAGNVLKDIIDSRRLPTVRLTQIFRQSRSSMIIVNAHRINSGEMPLFSAGEEYLHDFYFFTIEEPEKVVEKIVHLCKEGVPSKFGLDPVSDIQVLTPMHKGTVGVANLNAELQRELNPSKDELIRGGKVFKPGDKVLQLRNNYDKDVFNGDIGRIIGIDREVQEVHVDFDGRSVSYEFSELDEIVLAYATSVHKAQGSEYPVVIMPLLTQHYMLLQRNLLYTGITRGKKLVILVGTGKALSIAIHNNKPQMRYTMLKERLGTH